MESLSSIKLNLSKKLKNKGYRHRFFRLRVQDEISMQIRELRTSRNLRQRDLAMEMKTKQSAIARIEDSSYSGWSLPTLLKVAEALDARLKIVFQPMEDVIREYEIKEKVPDIIIDTPHVTPISSVYEVSVKPSQIRPNEGPPSFADVVRRHPTPKNRPSGDAVGVIKAKGISLRISEFTEQRGQPEWN